MDEIVMEGYSDMDFKPLAEVLNRPGLSNHGTAMVVLSGDLGTGPSWSLLRLPPGWRTRGPEFHSSLQEELLVQGDITFQARRFEAPAHFRFPAKVIHGPAKSDGGALILMVMEGPFDIQWTEIIDWDTLDWA